MTNPLSKPTNDWLKERGFVVRNTEWTNCVTGLKHDLFAFADKIAIKKNPATILLVQFTTHKGGEHKKHYDKITKDPKVWPFAKLCLEVGIQILLISWAKPRGKWTPNVQYITLKDFKSKPKARPVLDMRP